MRKQHRVGEAGDLLTQVSIRSGVYPLGKRVAARERKLREALEGALARMGIVSEELPDPHHDPKTLSDEAEVAFAAYLAYARKNHLATWIAHM